MEGDWSPWEVTGVKRLQGTLQTWQSENADVMRGHVSGIFSHWNNGNIWKSEKCNSLCNIESIMQMKYSMWVVSEVTM